MAEILLETAHYWAQQLGESDKFVRRALDGVAPEGWRGESQPLHSLKTVFNALTAVSDKLDANAERARKDKEAADKLAFENAETRGETARMTEADEWFGGHVERCRARLIQLPDSIGQFVDPANAAAVVAQARRLVYEALTELAADSAEAGSGNPVTLVAAADPDGESVGGSPTPAFKRGKRRARPVAN